MEKERRQNKKRYSYNAILIHIIAINNSKEKYLLDYNIRISNKTVEKNDDYSCTNVEMLGLNVSVSLFYLRLQQQNILYV